MCNFHALQVVGHGSETQLQVVENSNSMTLRYNGEHSHLHLFLHSPHRIGEITIKFVTKNVGLRLD